MLGQVSVKITVDGRVKRTRAETQAWVQEAAQQVLDMAKLDAPYKTGNLVTNIRIDYANSNSAVITSHAPYSVFQEEGTSRGVPATSFMENAMWNTRMRYSGKLTFTKLV
jgi:HK97 gp10 family phage protein